ncbi:MAG: hypothetical protein U0929_16520 [Planctomycetaceae bacterium]
MTYAARPGEGTILKIGAAANSVAELVGVNSVGLDGVERALVDNWHMTSTIKTQRPSLMKDCGKLSVEAQYDPLDTVHKLARDAYANTALVYWELVFASGAKATGNGYISAFTISGMGKEEGNLTCSFELKNNDLTFADA